MTAPNDPSVGPVCDGVHVGPCVCGLAASAAGSCGCDWPWRSFSFFAVLVGLLPLVVICFLEGAA